MSDPVIWKLDRRLIVVDRRPPESIAKFTHEGDSRRALHHADDRDAGEEQDDARQPKAGDRTLLEAKKTITVDEQ